MLASGLALEEGVGLRQEHPVNDDEHGRTGTEPVQRSPSMRGSINQAAGKCRSQQVSKRIALLQQAGHNTARLHGTVLERGRRGIAVQPTHGNPKESATSQKLLVGLTETRAQLQHNKQKIIHDKGPLPTPAIGSDSKCNGAHGPKHQHQGDSPGDVSDRFVERLRKIGGSQGHGEEVEGIPCPAGKSNLQPRLVMAQKRGSTSGVKHTPKKSHCFRLRSMSALKGLGAGFIGGTRVVRRVAIYLMGLIVGCSSSSAADSWTGTGAPVEGLSPS